MAAILSRWVSTLRPQSYGLHFVDNTFKCIFLSILSQLKFEMKYVLYASDWWLNSIDLSNCLTLNRQLVNHYLNQWWPRSLMHIWGVLYQKQVSRAGTSNYIPQYLWDVITCPCPWYLLHTEHFSYVFTGLKELIINHGIWVWNIMESWSLGGLMIMVNLKLYWYIHQFVLSTHSISVIHSHYPCYMSINTTCT